MSVKLSELLSKAADDVFERSYDCPIDESTAIRTRSRTLRSIAPALVEFSRVAWEPHACIPSDESCSICRFRSAMKAAGVTCE